MVAASLGVGGRGGGGGGGGGVGGGIGGGCGVAATPRPPAPRRRVHGQIGAASTPSPEHEPGSGASSHYTPLSDCTPSGTGSFVRRPPMHDLTQSRSTLEGRFVARGGGVGGCSGGGERSLAPSNGARRDFMLGQISRRHQLQLMHREPMQCGE